MYHRDREGIAKHFKWQTISKTGQVVLKANKFYLKKKLKRFNLFSSRQRRLYPKDKGSYLWSIHSHKQYHVYIMYNMHISML